MSNKKVGHRFKEGNTFGFTPAKSEERLDSPVTLKLTAEQRSKLKKMPGWQNKLREFIDQMITEEEAA